DFQFIEEYGTGSDDSTAILGTGQPMLMQAIDCIFFRRVQVGNPLARWWRGAINRPKTTRKTPIAGKSDCILVTISDVLCRRTNACIGCNGLTNSLGHLWTCSLSTRQIQ